jgi:uncharacterized protein (DUF3820 family)
MPFGKYKGIPMQDVPTEYLHWLWTKGNLNKNSEVGQYITKSLKALQLENKDLIWS